MAKITNNKAQTMYDTHDIGMFLYQFLIMKKNKAMHNTAIRTPHIRLPIEKLIMSTNPDNIFIIIGLRPSVPCE